MKKNIHNLLDWFEEHFNYWIELLAFIGGLFCLLFAIFLFIVLIFDIEAIMDSSLTMVFLPGVVGFFGVIILFALRITRHLTK